MTDPFYTDGSVTLYHGDCLDILRELPDNSVDSVCTDPPYGLEFMGREWDGPWKQSDINADAGFKGGGISATKGAPSFTGSTNPKCVTCKGTRRGRRDGTAKVAVCLCEDGGRFPNVRAVEMRAFQDWCEQWATECLRVLKPGGHILAFGGSRTWHRLACAVEDAGFEIRDSIAWLYGSGFPKSLDVSKAIDKAAGAEREVIGDKLDRPGYHLSGHNGGEAFGHGIATTTPETRLAAAQITAPATPDAQRWQGWGTALKPAFEPIVVGRKPLAAGTVAANVLAYGTGALNVDGCRVEGEKGWPATRRYSPGQMAGGLGELGGETEETVNSHPAGRWPSNVVLDDSQAAELDKQSGSRHAGGHIAESVGAEGTATIGPTGLRRGAAKPGVNTYSDVGGASRFFPVFRNECGKRLNGFPDSIWPDEDPGCAQWAYGACSCERECPDDRQIPTFKYEPKAPTTERPRDGGTAHPTVKPLDLMRWLVRLVTPPGGTVLEPFAGSGTTAEACVVEGFKCVAVEREADYLPLIVQRLTKPIQVALEFD